jgi:hypothetical protein
MSNINKRAQLRYLIHSCLAASLSVPMLALAQDDPEVEEVVVTGSYIRNSAFAQNSPVDTVSSGCRWSGRRGCEDDDCAGRLKGWRFMQVAYKKAGTCHCLGLFSVHGKRLPVGFQRDVAATSMLASAETPLLQRRESILYHAGIAA